MTDNVIQALRALGYRITQLQREDKIFYRIGWAAVPVPFPKEENKDAENIGRTSEDDCKT